MSSNSLEAAVAPAPGSTTEEFELEQQNRCQEEEPRSGSATPDAMANVVTLEDVPPDGGYGWEHFLSKDAFPGTSKFEYALVGGLSISQALIVGPLVVACQGWLGTRLTMLLGGVVIFAALFSASASTEVWHLMISQGLCFGYGMGFVYLPATEVLPHWFSSHRSLAVGLATSGAGIGGLAYSLITGRLIQALGFVWTYRILGFCSLSMITLSALLIKERKQGAKRSKSRPFNPHHFGRIEILLVVCWGFVTELGYIALLYSLPTYATSIGLNATQGSVVQAMLNLGLGVGRPVVGYYSDKVGRINMAMTMTWICAFLCFAIWIPAHSYPMLITFALLVGMTVGTFWSAVSPVLAEIAGLVELGSILGSIFLALVVPTTFAEAIAMQLVHGTARSVGDFLSSQIFTGCMFVIGALALFLLRSWKIADTERKAASEARHALTTSAATVSSRAGPSFWLTPRRAFRLERV